MRKILSVIFCALMLGTLALTVSAAAYMGLSPSATTLSPGDSFTVSVNLSNSEPVGRGGIVLSYDSSVFEFVGGSCNVSGATLAEVSASRNGGVFALAENRVVSGNVFTIRMRVRENAPAGSYTISGTASMDIACSAGSFTVQVVCKHSFDAFVPDGSTAHRHSCSLCGYTETAAHNWDSGTVTKAPTCRDTGLATYTCLGCGFSREDVLSANGEHVYPAWTRVDEKTHTGTCNLCGTSVSVAHNWDAGTPLIPATCTAEGSQKLTCTGCGETATVTVPKQAHTFSAYAPADNQSHTQICALCGLQETVKHHFGDTYRHNANEHFRLCDLCGYQSGAEAHTPGEPATDTTPQLCTDCGRTLVPAGNHIHSFETLWSMDEQTHYYACTGCNELSGLQLHMYVNECDTDCDICGYVRIAPHDFDRTLSADATGHYYACFLCGEKSGLAPHVPGEIASIASAQYCTVCRFELSPRLDHPHEYGDTHMHMCICGELSPVTEDCPYCRETFPWWILCIAEALAIAALLILPNIKEHPVKK